MGKNIKIMNYLDYFTNDTIRPVWITKNQQFKGGYLKPDWMRLLNQGITQIRKDVEKYKLINKEDPSKSNKTTSSVTAPPVSTTIKYLTNGLVFNGFPRSQWSISNFTVAPVKGS